MSQNIGVYIFQPIDEPRQYFTFTKESEKYFDILKKVEEIGGNEVLVIRIVPTEEVIERVYKRQDMKLYQEHILFYENENDGLDYAI